MIKTTTLSQEKKSSVKTKKAKKINVVTDDDFGPSDFTIQNILNYSKALQVIKLSTAQPVFGVMN
ncbi:MAG TPA: hypothetical protein VN698_14910 [Bacteroidia bacterium]|nr:hypothetical protein [Bacteroidia bacterium]